MVTRYPSAEADAKIAHMAAENCSEAPATLTGVSDNTEKYLREANAVLDNLHERLKGHTIPSAAGDCPKPERPSVLEKAHDVRDLAARVLDLSERIAASI